MDVEELDTTYREATPSVRRDSDVQRLSSRMTLLFILIPTMMCAAFAFAYVDLRSKLKETISSGEKEVQALSQDVLGRVTSVLEQYKQLEKAMAEKLSGIEKRLETVTAGLDRDEKAIKDLASAKVDAKDMEGIIQNGTKELAAMVVALKEGLDAQKTSVDKLAGKVEKELKEGANAVTTFQSDLRTQEEQVAKMAETLEGVQTKALGIELNTRRLLEEKEGLNQELGNLKKSTTTLQQKIDALAADITWMETRLNLKRDKPSSGEPKKKSQDEMSQPSSVPSTGGSILEQDIAR
jgi:chromosome segregation ATPase